MCPLFGRPVLLYLLLFRTLPRAVLIGVAIVITVYLLMNVSFFAVLSYDQIKSAEAVALVRLIHTLQPTCE